MTRFARAEITKKIVTIGLDPMVQRPAHQAFFARPLDCPVKPGIDDKECAEALRRNANYMTF